jgi:hypothetical protein
MKNNREVIGILSIVALVGVNSANADDNNLLIDTNTAVQSATKVALSVSRDQLIKKYENATSLNDLELKQVLEIVGFKGNDLKEAWAIAKKESNGRPLAFNGDKTTGDKSYGIFQINMIGDLGPARRDKFELDTNADLFNPVKNAEIAYHMSNGGKDWSAWKGITVKVKDLILDFPA